MDNNDVKYFDLGAVLSATTGRAFTNGFDVFDIFEFLTGRTMYSREDLIESLVYVKPYVLSIYPQLAGVGENEVLSPVQVQSFVCRQKNRFGNEFALSPVPEEFKTEILANLNTEESSKKK